MGCENLVIVYVNPHSNLPVWIYGQENIDDIEILADLYVPNGVNYTVVNKEELSDDALPYLLEDEVGEEDLENIFYDYLNAL